MKKLIFALCFIATVASAHDDIVIEPFEPIKSVSEQVQQERNQERLQEHQLRWHRQQEDLYWQDTQVVTPLLNTPQEINVYLNLQPLNGALIK